MALLVGVLSAVSVLSGQWLSARRDDKRWEREKQRELERWEHEDRLRWLQEKHQLYTEMMSSLQRHHELLRLGYHRHPCYGPLESEPREQARGKLAEARDKSQDAIEAIGILGNINVHGRASNIHLAFGMIPFYAERNNFKKLISEFCDINLQMDKLRMEIRRELRVDGAPGRDKSISCGDGSGVEADME